MIRRPALDVFRVGPGLMEESGSDKEQGIGKNRGSEHAGKEETYSTATNMATMPQALDMIFSFKSWS